MNTKHFQQHGFKSERAGATTELANLIANAADSTPEGRQILGFCKQITSSTRYAEQLNSNAKKQESQANLIQRMNSHFETSPEAKNRLQIDNTKVVTHHVQSVESLQEVEIYTEEVKIEREEETY